MTATLAIRAPQEAWGRLSQAERDAAYNNNAAVADSPAQIAARDAASAAFRAAHPEALDIPYGTAPRQKFDLYPAAAAGAPCLVFIHGGYWQRNSREQFAAYAEGPRAAGWSVAMPSHTLAPDASLSAIVAEIGAALDWLAREGAAHGIAGPLVLAGWSAGAHLTALHLSHPKVVAGLAISGVYELAPIRDTFLNTALQITDAEIAALSPLRLSPARKSLTIAYGTNELPALVHDSQSLHFLHAATGAPTTLIPISNADHFSILDELRAPDGLLVQAAQEVLDGARA